MKYAFLTFFLFSLLLTSCVTPPVKSYETVKDEFAMRAEIVKYARSLLGRKYLSSENGNFRNDCSGFVLGVYDTLGYEFELIHNTRSNQVSQVLYETLSKYGLIYSGSSPGRADVVFFKGTTVKSGDSISHVGVVDDILKDGTILILNYTSRGVTELRMNLDTPRVHKDESGTIKNDFLKKKSGLAENEKLLAGELFFCFGDLLKYAAL